MTSLKKLNNKVVVVNADLTGTCRTKQFSATYPESSFNVGIAEQNMVSFSAGLAHEGFIPYAFSMAPFISMRACEQCRTDVAYANVNVRLVATYAGCSGGISGATHWGMEDVAIMTSMANMTVLELSDTTQARKLLEKTLDYKGPVYIRSSVTNVSSIYSEEDNFDIGKSFECVSGDDGAFLCSGNIVQYAIEAANIIKETIGKNIRVVDLYSIKPIDQRAVVAALKTKNVIVAQDHNIIGGLGDIVSRIAVQEKIMPNMKVLGINDEFIPMAHAEYIYHKYEIDCEGLKKNMLSLLGE